ncbi:MAG: hypothetical protein Q4C49_12390 [Bacillota bacterium]|nr:hypothetical protein [Bacillota bacterium]
MPIKTIEEYKTETRTVRKANRELMTQIRELEKENADLRKKLSKSEKIVNLLKAEILKLNSRLFNNQ